MLCLGEENSRGEVWCGDQGWVPRQEAEIQHLIEQALELAEEARDVGCRCKELETALWRMRSIINRRLWAIDSDDAVLVLKRCRDVIDGVVLPEG